MDHPEAEATLASVGQRICERASRKSNAMPLNEDEKAELVAYLDGELDEAATQQVEAKIATDPELRAELDAMKQTWGMLDYPAQGEPVAELHQPHNGTAVAGESHRKQDDGHGRPARFAWAAALAGRRR